MSDGWRDAFSGTTMVYRMTPEELDCCQCDSDVNLQIETRAQDVRAVREERRDKGCKPRKLRFGELHNELLVILGPGMSANDAITVLERLIKTFRSSGMLCGRDSSGMYMKVWEQKIVVRGGRDAQRLLAKTLQVDRAEKVENLSCKESGQHLAGVHMKGKLKCQRENLPIGSKTETACYPT